VNLLVRYIIVTIPKTFPLGIRQLECVLLRRKMHGVLLILGSQGSIVSIVTKLQAERLRNRLSILDRCKRFFSSPKTFRLALGPSQPLIKSVPEALFPSVKYQGVATTHFCLVPSLKMSGSLPPITYMRSCMIPQRFSEQCCLFKLVTFSSLTARNSLKLLYDTHCTNIFHICRSHFVVLQ
jgi:hypothetical protein